MYKIIILPNINLCYNGKILYYKNKINLCSFLIKNNIKIKHICEKFLLCATCHVKIKFGFNNLFRISEKENNLLNTVCDFSMDSRLSCQVFLKKKNLIIDIPNVY